MWTHWRLGENSMGVWEAVGGGMGMQEGEARHVCSPWPAPENDLVQEPKRGSFITPFHKGPPQTVMRD